MFSDFRIPNITAGTVEGQIMQMQGYLQQMVQQLNIALNQIETSEEQTEIATGSEISAVAKHEAEAQKTFSNIKSLIIKSADIVEAYYAAINNKLEGIYVAKSEYGEFKEQTTADITANSTFIEQNYQDIQEITSTIEEIQTGSLETNAWIRTGLLEYDSGSVPVYGVEVGQRTQSGGVEVFNKYARFVADGIYFYLPGVSDAVAWMSGKKLYITNAEITGSLKLGRYMCDLSSGVAFKWAGGA